MKLRTSFGVVLALLVVSALLVPTAAAFADPAPILPALKVTTGSGAMWQSATASETTAWLLDSSTVDTSAIAAWVHGHSPKLNHVAVNATRKLNKKKKRYSFTVAKYGWKVNEPAAVAAITTQILAEAAETTPTSPAAFPLPTTSIKPKVLKFGKIILVVQSQHKIYLYNNMKVMRTYRCAVGMPAWPTPNGTFRIGKKVKWPTWRNGYASWSVNMPSFIGPSVNNPLGTRAMYVYKGSKDTGVRFHGVPHSEDPSIGHSASHGCLRMHRWDVEKFFNLVNVGTVVVIIK